MTLGEDRVGISVKSDGNEMVNKIKRAAADLIDLIETLRPPPPSFETREVERAGRVNRLLNNATAHFEDGAMWAVQAATISLRE